MTRMAATTQYRTLCVKYTLPIKFYAFGRGGYANYFQLLDCLFSWDYAGFPGSEGLTCDFAGVFAHFILWRGESGLARLKPMSQKRDMGHPIWWGYFRPGPPAQRQLMGEVCPPTCDSIFNISFLALHGH